MGRYGEMWGGMGRCGAVWRDMGRYGEIWGGMGRCGEVWGDVGRYGEMWGGMGRCGEVWGEVWRGLREDDVEGGATSPLHLPYISLHLPMQACARMTSRAARLTVFFLSGSAACSEAAHCSMFSWGDIGEI